MGWESTDVVEFDLGHLLQGQTNIAKFKGFLSRLFLVPEVLDGKPTHRKSWAENLWVWSNLSLGTSFKVKRIQPNLKVLITRLFLVLEVLIENQPTGNHRLRIFGCGWI